VAKLSQKSRRRMSSPPPASRGVGRARAAVADRRGRATEQRARCRTPHCRARSPECSASRARRGGPSVGLATAAGREGTFPPCKPLKTKETELESHKMILPRSEEADATAATVSPKQKGSRRRHPRRRSREIGGPADSATAKFSYPQALEKAQNGEGIWRWSYAGATLNLPRMAQRSVAAPAPRD
jgi:hypothetical protein